MRNPFCFCKDDLIREINPTINPDELQLFVSVDGTQAAYDDFMRLCTSGHLINNGFFSIACGPDGCGKSSLNYRNAYSISQKMTPTNECQIVDLSKQRLSNTQVSEKATHIYLLTLDNLKETKFISDNVFLELSEFKNVNRGMTKLSLDLKRTDKILIIILPEIELSEDLTEILNLKLPRILLLGEASGTDVHQHCIKVHAEGKNYVHSSELSKLEVADGVRFLSRRLEKNEGGPIINDADFKSIMTDRVNSPAGMNLRELHKLCANAYDFALEENLDEIEWNVLARHYTRNARII